MFIGESIPSKVTRSLQKNSILRHFICDCWGNCRNTSLLKIIYYVLKHVFILFIMVSQSYILSHISTVSIKTLQTNIPNIHSSQNILVPFNNVFKQQQSTNKLTCYVDQVLKQAMFL
jgi:hypothetical protein